MPGRGSVPLRFRCPYYRLSTRSVHVGMTEGLGKLSPEERPKAGALVNAVREALEAEIDTVKARMETADDTTAADQYNTVFL